MTSRSAAILGLLLAATLLPSCESAPKTVTAQETASATPAPKQLWTCGMHPQVIRDQPGPCPICGMQLTPLKSAPGAETGAGGTAVTVDPVIVHNMGVRVATVTEGPLHKTIRIVGYLDEAQPNQVDVNLRVSGWIEHLYADTEGMHLHRGQPLFDLYSPELRVGIDELIGARKARAQADGDGRATAESLYAAAERKLRLWGLTPAQIRDLAGRDEAPDTVTFTSPIAGHLMEKPIVEGAAVKAGDRVLRIVDHSMLWLDGRVFEQDLPYVRLGQHATASIDSIPGEHLDGEVTFLHPHVDPITRTALVRVALPNPSLALRPGMYATVGIDTEVAARAVLVPREAVIDSGTRQIAFVTTDNSHFEPRRVTVGAAGGDGLVQILSGLAPGETVVVSGQFLLDAESRLREAIEKHLRENLAVPAAGATVTEAENGQPNH